jgi:spoIIIJ-associated protein
MSVKEFEGRNEEEAINKAIESLGLDRDEIDVEIVETRKAPFLFGGGRVRIRVHLEEDRQQVVEEDPRDRQPMDNLRPREQRQPRQRGGRRGRGERQPMNGRGDGRMDGRGPRPQPAPEPPREPLPAEGEFENSMVEYLQGLVERMGIPGRVGIGFREERKLGLNIDTPDSGILIGKKGQTLEALQVIANIAASRMKEGAERIIVDTQNYRSRHEQSLIRMARQTAQQVRRTRQSRLLEAMNPFERRLVHTALAEEGDIETASEGDGLYKRIRVAYRGPAK